MAQSLGISSGTVGTTVLRARAAGLDWAQVERLTDEALEARVYGPPTPPTHHRPVPDCAYLHAERRKPGVTLELLHLEYLEQHPDGYRYTQFCELYRRWLQRRGLSMRQVHRAGEKCFVDYAGKKPRLIDPATGEVDPGRAVRRRPRRLELHLRRGHPHPAGPGLDREPPAGLRVLRRASPPLVVPDQLKSGVVVPCRYEPGAAAHLRGVRRSTTAR